MTSEYTERYPGLYATPELVGRKKILQQCVDILTKAGSDPKLFFFHGVGGIGKTRLLKQVLKNARELHNRRTAEEILDFYDILLHTPVEMVDAIFRVLTPPFDCFETYQLRAEGLTRARLSGDAVTLDQLKDDVLAQFEQDLLKLSGTQQVLIGLDTAERIVYGIPNWTDEIPFADSWTWLVEHLPKWRNVIVFVAGREETLPAIEYAKNKYPNLIEEVEVGPFSADESLEYFASVAALLKKEGDYQLGERLENMPESLKLGAHVYSEGRPILLSLLVDYLSFPGEGDLLQILRKPLPVKPSADEILRYKALLFDRLRDSELGDTLMALGRVPKGADEKLLATLLNVPIPEARRKLQEVQRLSVVKIRRKDTQQRFFLHDEMYALLQRHVYDGAFDVEKQEVAFEAIKRYYQEQRESSIQRLNALYAPVEEQGRIGLDLKELGKAHADHQALLTDNMYYFLRKDLGRGFRAYIRYSQEAILARDTLMDLQLQAELLAYLSNPPTVILEPRDDISIEMILASLKIRPAARAWASNKYQDGLKAAHHAIQSLEPAWRSQFPVLLAALHSWTASLHVMRSQKDDLKEAEKHLDVVYSLLPEDPGAVQSTDLSFRTVLWYKQSVLAVAHRIHGYLKWVQGFMRESVAEYQKAAVILREIDLRIEMAAVSNDMGFAQAELGKYHAGRANVLHALKLRRELGRRVPVALSLNTQAAIDVREGRYPNARQNSERALSIFRAFSQSRGIGLALITLAEATRRYAASERLLSSEERIDLLRRARDYGREAYDRFRETTETSRLVEAQIEIGCACRDLVWWLKVTPWPGDDIERTYAESLDALTQAAELALKQGLTHRYVDASVNKAWLEYYKLDSEVKTFDEPHILALTEQIEKSFPSDEEIEKQPQVWAQKGKLYVLKGHLARRSMDYVRKKMPKGISSDLETALRQLAENYALGLEFSREFGDDYQGIRQAKNSIFGRLIDLNAAEMQVVCGRIRELYPNGSTIETFLNDHALWRAG